MLKRGLPDYRLGWIALCAIIGLSIGPIAFGWTPLPGSLSGSGSEWYGKLSAWSVCGGCWLVVATMVWPVQRVTLLVDLLAIQAWALTALCGGCVLYLIAVAIANSQNGAFAISILIGMASMAIVQAGVIWRFLFLERRSVRGESGTVGEG